MALMDEARLLDILEDAMKANESTAYLNILKSVHQAVTALFGEKRKCATANQEVFEACLGELSEVRIRVMLGCYGPGSETSPKP